MLQHSPDYVVISASLGIIVDADRESPGRWILWRAGEYVATHNSQRAAIRDGFELLKELQEQEKDQ